MHLILAKQQCTDIRWEARPQLPQLRKVADSQAAPTWTGHCFSLIRVFISLSFSLDAKIITVRPIPPGLMLWVTSGWKRELDLSSSGHFTYSDVLLFVAAEAGCLDGFCAFKIVTIYLDAFMDLVLKETNLEGPGAAYSTLPFGKSARYGERELSTLLRYAI